MIRQGEPRDAERVYSIVTQFIDTAKFLCLKCHDKEKTWAFIVQMLPTSYIAEMDGKVVGMVAGYITTYQLSDDIIYQTLFWWADKDNREVSTKLYKHLESECIAKGVKFLVMGHMWESETVHLERFYNMHGFTKLETHYIRELT